MDFLIIYRTYFDSVYRMLLSLTRDPFLAEDLCSSTFLKVLESLDQFRGDGSMKNWLMAIAKNEYYSHLRKEGRIRYGDIPDEMLEAGPEEQLIEKESVLEMKRAIEHLSPIQQAILRFRVEFHLSFQEIGARYGKSENWACVSFYRAKQRLKKEMEDSNERL